MTRGLQATIIIVTSLFCLHLLRNISPVFPILAWLSAAIGVLRYGQWRGIDRAGMFISVGLLLAIAYTVAISFVFFPEETYFMAIARFIFILPFAGFAALVIDTRDKQRLALQTFAAWVVVGTGTVFYQTIFGPIDWFALPTDRAGSIRYASLIGNLTALGVVGGLALPLIYFLFRHTVLRGVMLGIVGMGLVISLQKAATANIFIFALAIMALSVFALWRRQRALPSIATLGVAAATFLLLAVPLATIEPKGGSLSASNTLHGTRENIVSFDNKPKRYAPALAVSFPSLFESASSVSAEDDAPMVVDDDVDMAAGTLGRLTALPAKLIQKYGPTSLLTGVGLVGGSGTLGFLDTVCSDPNDIRTCRIKYPMAHNAAIELLIMGGIPLLLSFCLFIGLASWRLAVQVFRDPADKLACGALVTMLLFVPNAMMSSGVISQPYIAGILYAICLPVLLRKDLLRDRT